MNEWLYRSSIASMLLSLFLLAWINASLLLNVTLGWALPFFLVSALLAIIGLFSKESRRFAIWSLLLLVSEGLFIACSIFLLLLFNDRT